MIKDIAFNVVSTDKNKIIFHSKEQDVYMYILEEDVFRIFIPTDNHPIMNKTWTIAPMAEDIPAEGRDRFDLSPFSLPKYHVITKANQIEVSTSNMKAMVDLNGFKISWYGKKQDDWVLIVNDRKTQSYNFNKCLGDGVFHYLQRSHGEHYYGLGEKSGTLNKAGKRYRMLNIDAMGYDAEHTDPLYKHIPFYVTYNEVTKLSYGLFYDNYSDSVFDMGSELDNYHGNYKYYQAKNGNLDYYFFYGPQVKEVVEKFSKLTGNTILPPKWSLGYSGSTMTYTDAPDAQEQLKKFVEACKSFDIPCDLFQLSSGYTSIEGKRYVFHWNLSKIPDPHAMVDYFHDNKINISANIKPAFLKDHPLYEELEKLGYFILSSDGVTPEIAQFWDDTGSYLDFTNKAAFDWWKSKVKKELLEYGIDSTWNDNNEYEIWDDTALANGFEDAIPVSEIKPIQTMLMMKASYEAQLEHNPDRRPYLISRSGAPGMQRYVQTWTGDNFTEWKTIRYNLKMGLGLSLSGIYNYGHDVGGFAGSAPDPELFIRWIQNGIFHPRFTIHSWNDDNTVNVPWMYPDYMEIISKLMKERVKWIPYLYHLLHVAHTEYKPILTPTFYYFENDPNNFRENDDFLVGGNLLVCNVVEKDTRTREVYLPDNEIGWYDLNDGRFYEGKSQIVVDAPLDKIPMFAQSGSVFPVRDGEISFKNKNLEERGLLIYPTLGEGYFTASFYEDDGESFNYKKGEFAYIKTVIQTYEDKVDIRLAVEGDYHLPYDHIKLYLPSTEKRSIFINGQNTDSKRPLIWNIEQ
ncbi:glycoside hydrolase family 31 protein [Oceanobacillus saliphilus]|uniref:glycoside hydrolase family 31 protein n=1 Tax=Oceanobacillus saliphilus TaxID=2925834 RepID=UPI00201D9B94|nr:glycoside hydrolase family 31 protein [Oceanobacillus saliphilus]